MTPRRPDAHTREQRHRERVWNLVNAIMRDIDNKSGWDSAAISRVRIEDERRGIRFRAK